VRQLRLPDSRELLVSDTVGFIDRLPHALVAAFRATLEEVAEADLILHVIDAAAPDRGRRMDAVRKVLEEVGAIDVPLIDVYNKCDAMTADERRRLQDQDPSALLISSLTLEGLDELVDTVASRLALDVRRDDADLRSREPCRPRTNRASTGMRTCWCTDARRPDLDRGRYSAAARRSYQPVGRWEFRVVDRPLRFRFSVMLPWRSRSSRPPADRRQCRCPICRRPRLHRIRSAGRSRDIRAVSAAIASVNRGWRFLEAGDLRNAERDFRTALRNSTDFYPGRRPSDTWNWRRRIPKRRCRTSRSAAERPAVRLGVGRRADRHFSLGREADALFAFQSAVAVDPLLADVKRRIEVLQFRGLEQDLAAARQSAKAGKFDDAARAYTNAIASSPESAFLYRELASVEAKRGKTPPLSPICGALAIEPRTRDRSCRSAISSPPRATSTARGDPARKRYRSAERRGRSRTGCASREPNWHDCDRLSRDRYRAPSTPDLAALIGVSLPEIVQSARQRDGVVITDMRTHWAATWMMAVARAGIMDSFDNHTFSQMPCTGLTSPSR
jgi:tetratricopeptide (TPR) repeat protein